MTTESEYRNARHSLMLIVHAILETVEECGERGAPLGPLYAAFMTTKMGYETFMEIVQGLQDANKIKVVGHVAYFNRVAE